MSGTAITRSFCRSRPIEGDPAYLPSGRYPAIAFYLAHVLSTARVGVGASGWYIYSRWVTARSYLSLPDRLVRLEADVAPADPSTHP